MSDLDEVRRLLSELKQKADEAEQKLAQANQKKTRKRPGGGRRRQSERKPHAPFWFITYTAMDGQHVKPNIPADPEEVIKEPAATDDDLLFKSERWFRMLPDDRMQMDSQAERHIIENAMKLIHLGVRQLDVWTYRTNGYGQRVDHRRILRYSPTEGPLVQGPDRPPKRRGRDR